MVEECQSDNPRSGVRFHVSRRAVRLGTVISKQLTRPEHAYIMNNLSHQNSEFFNSNKGANLLWEYVQSLDPEMAARLAQPSPDVIQVMERNVVGLLGGLPSEHFGVTITTNRENLGRLLASAMMSGYFLHNAEQRMAFERQLTSTLESQEEDSE
jgi:hypothetical protein